MRGKYRRFDDDVSKSSSPELFRKSRDKCSEESLSRAPSCSGAISDVDSSIAPHIPTALAQSRDCFAIESIVRLNEITQPIASSLGFQSFAGARLSGRQNKSALQFLFGSRTANCEHWYSNLSTVSARSLANECRTTREPFYLSDLADRSQFADAILPKSKGHQPCSSTEIFIVPVELFDRSILVVVLLGNAVQTSDPKIRAAATVLATYYASTGYKLWSLERRCGRYTPLTERQYECLCWVRAGKSSTDIGTILDISADVVDEHIAKACRRLGVVRRMHAVIAATEYGILDK